MATKRKIPRPCYRCEEPAWFRFCSYKCARQALESYPVPEIPRHKYNARKVTLSGYVYRHVGGGKFAREHVLVFEAYMGRFIRDGEQIHHIDEDPLNNVLSNLTSLTLAKAGAHTAKHNRARARERPRRKCLRCPRRRKQLLRGMCRPCYAKAWHRREFQDLPCK